MTESLSDESLPCFIGYYPDEAEAAARQLGIPLVWVEAESPRWLSPRHEPRVARQRLRDDGTLELLRVMVPMLEAEE